ncbi:MAG: hypothetical protein V2A79_14825 [Planctomycetota bacterium]
MNATRWTIQSYRLLPTARGLEDFSIVVERTESPFYVGERWAVRWGGHCLNVCGDWEHEPIPSERGDAFYGRCRFTTVSEAMAEAEVAAATHTINGYDVYP